MPTTLTNGIQLPDKGSVDWYNSMQSNYNLIDTHLGNTDTHVTAEDRANWNSKQGSLSQAQLDAIAQVATNTNDIATLQSGKANASHTHSSSDITDIGDYATKQYVDNSISGLVDSAPNALDTLNELAAALNDDANFASTVATALSNKANSADLAAVATSGSYNDLSNKPTINDSTITIQKNGSLVGTFTVNGSAKTIDIPVPTKTSDLTNDSNFVDTSNSAVASGITAAKVTSYDSHVADTDIHVTTADKSKWDNGVTQSYVFRYSGTAITNNSTIAYSTIDNTDNIKSGDKILDVDGKLFEITAVDTTNQTVTVGSALIDLALDANVVHTSGDETVGGRKTFSENITCFSNSDAKSIICKTPLSTYDSTNTVGDNTKIRFLDKNNNSISYIMQRKLTNGSTDISLNVSNTDSNNQPIEATLTFVLDSANEPRLSPGIDNTISIGRPTFRYKSFYGMNYYYGSNNVEFSTKFVTTDTNQTITGSKTFGNGTLIVDNTTGSNVHGEIKLNGSRSGYIVADNASDGVFDSAGCGVSILLQDPAKPLHVGAYKVDANGRVFVDNTNKNPVLSITSGLIRTSTLVPENDTANSSFRILSQLDYANGDASKVLDVRFQQNDDADATSAIYSYVNNKTSLGTESKKWKDCQTKLINGLTPSSLGMPVAPSTTSYVDISGYITVLDSSSANTYTPPSNGYITFSVTGNLVQIFHDYGLQGKWTVQAGNANRGFIPVLGGVEVKIYITASSVDKFWFIPCQGNI